MNRFQVAWQIFGTNWDSEQTSTSKNGTEPKPDLSVNPSLAGSLCVRAENDTYIASTTGIGVYKPCSSNIGRPLDNFKISSIEIPNELDGHANPRHASSNYENICVKGHGATEYNSKNNNLTMLQGTILTLIGSSLTYIYVIRLYNTLPRFLLCMAPVSKRARYPSSALAAYPTWVSRVSTFPSFNLGAFMKGY